MDNNLIYNKLKKSFYWKMAIVCFILVSIIGFLCSPKKANVFETIYYININQFCIIVYIILFITNSIYLYKYFFSNYPILLRLNSFNNCNKIAVKTLFKINSNMYLKSVIVTFVLSIIKNYNMYIIEMHSLYNIPLFIYDVFMIIRLFLIINLISLAAYYIMTIFARRYYIIICGTIIIITTFLFWTYKIDIISNISQIKIFFGYYLIGFDCISFNIELLFSIIYILLLYLIVNYFELFYRKVKIYDFN